MTRSKTERHKAIKRILRQKEVRSQQELAEELSGLGFEVTLATVSRDIAELSLVRRRNASGEVAWSLPEQEHLDWMLRELVSGVEAIENMVLVKCSTGTAQGVAAAIDGLGYKEIAGTVAGDDTILIITRWGGDAARLAKSLGGEQKGQ